MVKNVTLSSRRGKLLMLLHEAGPVSQADAARQLGVSAAAVNVHVKSLKKTGILQEESADASSVVGRPGVLLSIDKVKNLTLSIVFDALNCKVGLADFTGELLKSDTIELADIATSTGLMEQLSLCLTDYLDYAREKKLSVRFACVACPGKLDYRTGEVIKSANVPILEGIDFEAELRRRFGLESHVVSEASARFWGEFDRQGNGAECMMLNWGVGVGCIIGHGNQITYPSPNIKGMRGDLGHVVVEPQGRACKCGQRGCLEAYVGGVAMVDRLRETGQERYQTLTYKDLLAAAHAGDETVLKMITESARLMGEVFSWPAMLMGVKQVALIGGLGELGDVVLEPFIEGLSRRLHKEAIERMKIVSNDDSCQALLAGAHALAAKLYLDDSILESIRLES